MTADISETRAQPAACGMTTDASATAVQPGLPQALPPVPPPRRDGRTRNGRSGPAVRPRASAHLIPRPAAERGGLAAQLVQERMVTLELQRAILPLHDEPFDAPGLRIAMRYLPASRDSRVGGDWYITAELPAGQVLIAIGDVAGHGLPAAAGMARLRGALAGLAITGSPPDRLVGWLNDLVHHVAPEHTASVMAGYFDPDTRVLTWAQAGHPPPVLVRGTTARPLDAPDGILLGAAKEEYQLARVDLLAGDLLLLYSDGLIERRDRALDEGLATLCAAVRGARDPERAIAAALSALGTTDPEDDTCLVALRIL
jgi:serine phosphatase RsbU (regulator of sigma subunit)